MDYTPAPNIETTLPGLTLVRAEQVGDEFVLETADDRSFKLYHSQDCCESVAVDGITGNLSDILGSPLTQVKETIDSGRDDGQYGGESWTVTHYHFTTSKGTVTIKWVGSSNGYYSESVSFVETTR